jgi:hypothetical protein
VVGQRALREIPVSEIQVAGQTYALDRVLGESTARVLLSKDRASVIKIFPPSQAHAARLEYWTTLFYVSHSQPVLAIQSPAFETVYDGGPVVALVKPYREGLTAEEFEKLCKENHSASGDCAELRQQRSTLRAKLRELHEEGEFIAWLGSRCVKIEEEFGPLADTLDFVDLTDSNFLLTAKGWVESTREGRGGIDP